MKIKKFSTLAAALIFVCLISPGLFPRVYSDGLFQEDLPGVPIGEGKYAGLYVRINPVLIDGPQTLKDRYLELKFLDVVSKTPILHTTFDVSIAKISNSAAPANGTGEILLMHDKFHSHTGTLTLSANNTRAAGTIAVSQGQQRDTFYGAWITDDNGTEYLDGPLFSEGGLYHLRVNILGYGSDDNTVSSGQIPPFDAWLSIGSATHYTINYDQRDYNITLISYYDKTKQFNFDLENKTVTWAMPFVWNQEHILAQQINVHEEFRIPKALIADMQSSSFSPFIDGIPLTNQAVYLDPYSSATDMTIHYVISKDTIVQLERMNATGGNTTSGHIGQMLFSFLINGPKLVETSTYLKVINATSENPVSVSVKWSPDPLNAYNQETARITFFESGEQVNSTVLYAMKIRAMNSSQSILLDREGLQASHGIDLQQVTFPKNSTYSIEIDLHRIQGYPENNSAGGLTSSSGMVTKGIVVVPEFGHNPSIATLAMLVPVIIVLASRAKRK